MISIEQLIQRLEALHEENNDPALEVSIDIFNRLRRNISAVSYTHLTLPTR